MNDDVKKIKVCEGNSCAMDFADDVYKKLKKKCAGRKDVEVSRCGCQAMCSRSVVVVKEENGERKHLTEVSERDFDELCG